MGVIMKVAQLFLLFHLRQTFFLGFHVPLTECNFVLLYRNWYNDRQQFGEIQKETT